MSEEIETLPKDKRKLDILVSRCEGLHKYGAVKMANNAKVKATNVTKADGPFYCPECLCDAVVRKCVNKIDHFAHKALFTPVVSRNSVLHNKCRDEILLYLQSKYPMGNWAIERKIPRNDEKGTKDIVPDISGRINNNKPLAIEVQLSSYTINKIYDKTLEYKKRSIPVLWIVPLTKRLEANKIYRPRLYEKYLHSMYFGRVYYWVPDNNSKLMPVHFSPAKRYIEESEWYEKESGEYRSEGGFYLTYKTIKAPNIGESVDISTDFSIDSRTEFIPKNEKKKVPECLIYKDNQKEWWDKDEFRNLEKQFTVIKDTTSNEFLGNYNYYDDYDDYDEYLV